jgi:virginiamycin B lyase
MRSARFVAGVSSRYFAAAAAFAIVVILENGCSNQGRWWSIPHASQSEFASHAITFSITTYPLPEGIYPFGIIRGDDGNMWFTEQEGGFGDIGRITPAGQLTYFPVFGNRDGECIIRGAGHDLWFASNQSRLIGRITLAGNATTYTAAGIAPYCVALGSDGKIWFTDTAKVAIGRLNLHTGRIDEFKLSNPSSVPMMITPGPDGNVWFTDNGAGEVGKVTPAGLIIEYSLPSGPYCKPYGIVSGPDGALYVGELESLTLARITTGGSITEYPHVLVGNSALGVGPDGEIWLSDASTIERFNIKTHVARTVATAPNGGDVITYAIGPDRDLWFTSSGSSSGGNYVGLIQRTGGQ